MVFQFCSPFQPAGDQAQAIAGVVDGLREGKRYQVLRGITGSGKTYTMAKTIAAVQRPTLIVAHNKLLAKQLFEEMCGYFPQNAVCYFVSNCIRFTPEAYLSGTGKYIDKIATTDNELTRHRVETMLSLLQRRDVIVVASTSCLYGLGPQDAFCRTLTPLYKGQTIDPDQLLSRLDDVRYLPANRRLRPGTCQAKGNSVTALSMFETTAWRVDIVQNTIADLLRIDATTGNIIESCDATTIYPAYEFVMSHDELSAGIPRIRREAKGRIRQLHHQGKRLEAQRLEARVRADTQLMQAVGYCSGIENYAKAISGGPSGTPTATLLDHFPDDVLLFIDESHCTVPQIRGMHRGDLKRKRSLVDHGFVLPSAIDRRPLTLDEVENGVGQIVFVSATPGSYELGRAGEATVDQIIRPTGLLDPVVEIEPLCGAIDHLTREIRRRKAADERVLVTVVTKVDAERVTRNLKGRDIRCRWLHSDLETTKRTQVLAELREGKFDVLVGCNLLREGLDLPEVSLVAVLDADKEGFLRDETSLIQMIGRAARHVNGKAILYADTVTGSMIRAIEVSRRRRCLQEEHNGKHGITPMPVSKSICAGHEDEAVRDTTATAVPVDNMTREGS